MRLPLLLSCLVLTGCAALQSLVTTVAPASGHEGLIDSLGVTAAVNGAVSDQDTQGFCVTEWQVRGQSADLIAVTAATTVESVQCQGLPVLLVRPMCMFTAREAIWYRHSTPFVAVRCPYGAAVWVTGFPFPTPRA